MIRRAVLFGSFSTAIRGIHMENPFLSTFCVGDDRHVNPETGPGQSPDPSFCPLRSHLHLQTPLAIWACGRPCVTHRNWVTAAGPWDANLARSTGGALARAVWDHLGDFHFSQDQHHSPILHPMIAPQWSEWTGMALIQQKENKSRQSH